jgi:DNA-binding response OmpR family regulator
MDKKRVLIIDDEKSIVKSTCMALAIYGFEAEGALSGQAGISAAREKRPDLILLDIMMPGMDGWTVLGELKRDTATFGIPVIIFTAKEHADGAAMAKSQGACDYVAKPFEPEELAGIIRKHLSKGA